MRILETRLPVTTSAPDVETHATRASVTSGAPARLGNTRQPLSTTVSMPREEKKALKSSTKNRDNAWRRKRPFLPKWGMKSDTEEKLLRLHLPLPVILNLRPGRSIRSNSIVLAPWRAAVPAAIKPAAPPPTTITW
jgi:hypothetical protein